MNSFAKVLVITVIIVHLMFFTLEAIFWMYPLVYNQLLGFLNNPVTLDYPMQALVLKKLFINQGFYNLFLACAGMAGLVKIKAGKFIASYALVLLLCFAAIGAGIVLAVTTKAYLLAFLQTVPAAAAFMKIYPLYELANVKNES